jgi:peptide-methionine (S)-S-oxide reductase
MKTELATFAMGCFWHVQLVFDQVPGVIKTRVGYTGGAMKNPTYENVCSDETGHAEAVEVEFDPSKVDYGKLLDVFWRNHDPTTVDRQGPDEGSQYRSAIFYHGAAQKAAAEKSKAAAQKKLGTKNVVTQIVEAGQFYAAEEYHQKYLAKRGQTTCRI